MKKRYFKEHNYSAIYNDGKTLRFAVDQTKPITELKPITPKCYYSLLYVLASATGSVFPCGLMSRKNQNSLGNLNSDSWETILERQKIFFENIKPLEDEACKGCWEINKNRILEEIVENNIETHPELSKLGGYSTLYCRY